LRNANPDDFFTGTPHPYLLEYKNWIWANRFIKETVELNPDWLITYKTWVEVKNSEEVGVFYSGPYIIIHSNGNLKDNVVPKERLVFWKLRRLDHKRMIL